jgi:teichuronic acid biosynthesis glycosyltransferase TuaG
MDAPAVSVIVPVWNAARTLEATVASVRAQSEPDWEMWLIDDGSTDASLALARQLAAGDARIAVLSLGQNQGAAAARNAGIRAARGRFIAFLDADDLWRPEKLALQLAAMRAGHAFVFSAYRRMDAEGRPLGTVPALAEVDYARALRGNAIGCLTAIYDSAHFGKVEMPDIRRRQDYGLWLTLLRRGGVAHGLPQVLADYRLGAGSLSSNKLVAARATWRVYRQVEQLPLPRASYYFLCYATGSVLRRL